MLEFRVIRLKPPLRHIPAQEKVEKSAVFS